MTSIFRKFHAPASLSPGKKPTVRAGQEARRASDVLFTADPQLPGACYANYYPSPLHVMD
jgi:hypothetical protein